MGNKTRIFLSHDLQILAKNFLQELSKTKPFEKICCIVSNQEIKNWLFEYAVQNNLSKIFLGIKFLSLEEALETILKFSNEAQGESIHPFFFQILCYEKLKKLPDQTLYQPIKEYLSKSKNHIYSLSQKLGTLFWEYNLYYFHQAKQWREVEDWQKHLWYEIFSENKELFLSEYLSRNVTKQQVPYSLISIFGLDFMPDMYFDCLCRLAENIPVFHYLFSPTYEYWEDALSFFEQRKRKWRAQKKKVSLKVIQEEEKYCNQIHPFLANWGKMGRSYLHVLNQYDVSIHENYAFSIEEKSLLQNIQSEILQCIQPLGYADIKKDESIQIHRAGASKLREVEILFEHLYHWIFECKIPPEDILILSSNIQEYVPYIHLVFGSRDNMIPYSIRHLCLSSQSFLANITLKWFSLVWSHWKSSIVIELLQNPLLQRHLRISQKEATDWIHWIHTGKIQGEIHKAEWTETCIHKKPYGADRNWEKGIKRLLATFVLQPEGLETIPDIYPMPGIQSSDMDSVIRFLKFFKNLYQEIKTVESVSNRLASEWALLLEKFLKNFSLNLTDPSEKSAEGALQNYVEDLRFIAKSKNRAIAFEIFYEELKNRLSKSSASYRSSFLGGVQFTSFNPVPTRVIYILGGNESTLNRSFHSLDKLARSQLPTSKDQFRYQFLKALSYAKEYFWISYNHISPTDGTEVLPNSCIQDFLSLLEEKGVLEKCLFTHPHLMFHLDYFKKDSTLKNYSEKHQNLFNLYYKKNQEEKTSFAFDFPCNPSRNTLTVLHLQDLLSFARNPLQQYFRSHLQTKLERRLYEDKDESAYKLSFFDLHSLREQYLKNPSEKIVEKYKKTDLFPVGPFEKVAMKQWKTEVKSLQEALHQIKPKRVLKTLHLDFSFQKVEDCFPPINIENVNFGSISVIGEIDKVSSEGLVLFCNKNAEDLIRHWPKILMYLSLAYREELPPNILLLKDEKVFSLTQEQTNSAWLKYLQLYLIAYENPIPFARSFVQAFQKKNFHLWMKNYQQTLNYDDIYLNWIKRHYKVPLTKETFDKWSEIFEETYGAFL